MSRSCEPGVQAPSLQKHDSAQAALCRSSAYTASARDATRVLVVDDERNILSSLRRLFRRENYELVTAGNATEALRIMEAKPAHVVISDYRMPGITGTQLLREVQSRWPDTVRIVLSGYSEVKAIIDAINEGAIYKFISKPWIDEEILLNVRRAVEQYELAVENRRLGQEIAQQNEQLRELNRLLDQRATDASSGQTVAQELLEAVHAGLLVVDPDGLIVAANQRALDILQLGTRGLIGLPAVEVLPGELNEAIRRTGSQDGASASGQLQVETRKVDWHLKAVQQDGRIRGMIATFWGGAA